MKPMFDKKNNKLAEIEPPKVLISVYIWNMHAWSFRLEYINNNQQQYLHVPVIDVLNVTAQNYRNDDELAE